MTTSTEALAESWASIDGKLEAFILCKHNPTVEEVAGRYGGYMAEAEQMIKNLEVRGYELTPMKRLNLKELDESTARKPTVLAGLCDALLKTSDDVSLRTRAEGMVSIMKDAGFIIVQNDLKKSWGGPTLQNVLSMFDDDEKRYEELSQNLQGLHERLSKLETKC